MTSMVVYAIYMILIKVRVNCLFQEYSDFQLAISMQRLNSHSSFLHIVFKIMMSNVWLSRSFQLLPEVLFLALTNRENGMFIRPFKQFIEKHLNGFKQIEPKFMLYPLDSYNLELRKTLFC